MLLIICQICLLLSVIIAYYFTAETAEIIYEIHPHLIVVYAGIRQQKYWISDFRKCDCWTVEIQVINFKESRNLTLESAGIRL